MCVSFWGPASAACGVRPTVGLLGVRGLSHLLSGPHAMSHSSCSLHSHRQCTHVLVSPHLHQPFSFASLWVLWELGSSQRKAMKWYLTEALVCVSLS